MPRRWILLAVGLPLYLLALMIVGSALIALLAMDDISDYFDAVSSMFQDAEWWFFASISAGIIVGMQAVFLLPVFRFRMARSEKAKPLLLSVLLLAVIAASLTTGLVLGVSELWAIWRTPPDPGFGYRGYSELADEPWFPWVLITLLAVSWLFWSILLARFARRSRRPESWLGRWVGILLGGTMLEVLVVVPVDVMVRRRTDCYCATGTFYALLAAILAALFLTGPGVVIALTSRRRRPWYDTHCERCGYEQGPSPGIRCPECGHTWLDRGSGGG